MAKIFKKIPAKVHNAIVINKKRMNTLTLITENQHLNHHYSVDSVSIVPQRFVIVIDDDEIDDFLKEFIGGKTGYRIQIDTDMMRVETKGLCFSENSMQGERNNKTAFAISVEKKVS